jgi:hypothetical protein
LGRAGAGADADAGHLKPVKPSISKMKLLFHAPGHHKNAESIKAMCASRGLDLEFTNDDARVFSNDYNILVLNSRYISPDALPPHVKVIYGPQHWIFPEGPLLGSHRSELDGRCVYNSLCDWNKDGFETEWPQMIMRCEPFPYGIETERCAPDPSVEKTIDCVVYFKDRHPSIYDTVEKTLKAHGLNYVVFRYGSYKDDDYVAALKKARFMVVVGRHESQGFAIQEALARDIPLLVLDVKSMHEEFAYGRFVYSYLADKNLYASAVPYWSDDCGIRIFETEHFPYALDVMCSSLHTFAPRRFILENLTPAHCMDRILSHFGGASKIEPRPLFQQHV